MNGYQKVDLSQVADCIKSSNYFGQTIYYNICNGTSHIVPWGGCDWAWVFVPVAIAIAIIILIIIWISNSY